MGTADVPGVLIGYPALDCSPFGWGWQQREYTHFFAAVGAHLPRAELSRRTAMMVELAEWKAAGTSSAAEPEPGAPALPTEQCHLLREAAQRYCMRVL